ncbi:hypothetical protein OAQ23_06420 [Hellea sp.]|nr:hypothetical protein [Hellea sp.]
MIKKITLGITLLFSTLMFASPAYADWEWISKNGNGTFYVDTDRIRTNGGYVYYWELVDLLKPLTSGNLSYKVYNQVDCNLFRYKNLSGTFYNEPMGEGSGDTFSPPNPEWNYPAPNTSAESILNQVCKFAENL